MEVTKEELERMLQVAFNYGKSFGTGNYSEKVKFEKFVQQVTAPIEEEV